MPRFRRKKIKGIPADQLDKVMKSEKVHKAVDAKAAKVQEYWQSIAPVFDVNDKAKEHRAAPPYGDPGAYRDSITVVDMSDESGFRDRVKPTDFKAKWIEFGSAHMPTYAPMAKTKAQFRK
jgi:hypothetical protein